MFEGEADRGQPRLWRQPGLAELVGRHRLFLQRWLLGNGGSLALEENVFSPWSHRRKQVERGAEERNYSDGLSVGRRKGKKKTYFNRRPMVRPSPEKYVRMCL